MMVYPQQGNFFQIFTQSIDANDVTSVTLSHLNSINAIDVTRPGMSVFYRDILRKQYIASFGNIRKYRDTRGYHDIFTIFFYA